VDEADAPPQAVRLAAGELLLRIAEERRRRAAGLDAAGAAVPQRRMTGKAGARPAARPNSAAHLGGGIAVCGSWLPVRCCWAASVVLAAGHCWSPHRRRAEQHQACHTVSAAGSLRISPQLDADALARQARWTRRACTNMEDTDCCITFCVQVRAKFGAAGAVDAAAGTPTWRTPAAA